jgi:RHS repeat-associated protein
VQHLEYIPFGEVFIDERAATSTWSTPYKFNAKELDEETGLYYYGARYYDPRTSVWISVDPLAEKKPWMSPYVYCSGNPVNRIDPDGRDDYRMDRDGNMTFVKQTDAENHTIYATNSKGGVDNKNSVQVSKDVLSSKITESVKTRDSNGNPSSAQVEVFTAFGDKQSTEFFEFASKNSDVEWTQVKATVDGAQGYEQVNYIGTSHTDGNDASQSFISSFVPNGVTVREANHNHPNNTTTVSQGDINVATKVQSRFPNATFNIFSPGNSQYTPYNMFSVPGLLKEIIITPSK